MDKSWANSRLTIAKGRFSFIVFPICFRYERESVLLPGDVITFFFRLSWVLASAASIMSFKRKDVSSSRKTVVRRLNWVTLGMMYWVQPRLPVSEFIYSLALWLRRSSLQKMLQEVKNKWIRFPRQSLIGQLEFTFNLTWFINASLVDFFFNSFFPILKNRAKYYLKIYSIHEYCKSQLLSNQFGISQIVSQK